MGKQNYFLIFVVILLLGLGLRVQGLDNAVFDDETNFVDWINNPGPYKTANPFRTLAYPPLGAWIYYLFGTSLGLNVLFFRMVPLVFWILNLVLVYAIVKRNYGGRPAVFAAGLFAFSYYSFMASLQIDVEGSILTFTFLLMAYSYLRFKEREAKGWLLLTGIGFGLSLLTKNNSLFFLPVIGLYELWITRCSVRNYLKIAWNFIRILIPAGLIFSIFPLLTPELFFGMRKHASGYFGLNISLMAIGMILFWATPLLLGPAFLQSLKRSQKDKFFVVWIVVIFSIFTFFIVGRAGTHGGVGGVADYSRHFTNLIGPLSILGGVYLSRLRFSKSYWRYMIGVGSLFLAACFLINYHTVRILPRDFSVYLKALRSFDTNFLFSYTTSTGNLLAVNMGVILFSIGASFLVLVWFWATRKKWIMATFLAIALAFNVFLVVEYLGPVTSPDLNGVYLEMVNHVKGKAGLVFVNDEGLLFHLNDFQYQTGENQKNLGRYMEGFEFIRGGARIVFFDWPPLPEDHPVYGKLATCVSEKNFYSRNVLVGSVYIC